MKINVLFGMMLCIVVTTDVDLYMMTPLTVAVKPVMYTNPNILYSSMSFF